MNKVVNEQINKIRENSQMSTENFLLEGERWLLENGVVTDVTHNNIIMNLYMNFPKCKYVEYFMDLQNKQVEVYIYFGLWRYLFTPQKKVSEKCKDLLLQYLNGFTITAKKEKYGRQQREERDEQTSEDPEEVES